MMMIILALVGVSNVVNLCACQALTSCLKYINSVAPHEVLGGK